MVETENRTKGEGVRSEGHIRRVVERRCSWRYAKSTSKQSSLSLGRKKSLCRKTMSGERRGF